MNNAFLRSETHSLRFQRNALLAFSFLLSASLLLSLTLLSFKQERIIVTPPLIEKEFWVSSSAVSSTYLEQFGLFLSKLLFEKTPHSSRTQREAILRQTDPSFAAALNAKLLKEEESLLKQNASYVFFPEEVNVNPQKKSVSIRGERVAYILEKPISKEKERYTLTFRQSGSRLLLNSLEKTDD
jgi:conjugal transfer pilus assembly protein TraE